MSTPPYYGNVTVGSSAVKILDANTDRKGAILYNNGSVTVYAGFDADVTTSTGLPIGPGAVLNDTDIDAAWRGEIWGVVTTGTTDVRFWDYGP